MNMRYKWLRRIVYPCFLLFLSTCGGLEKRSQENVEEMQMEKPPERTTDMMPDSAMDYGVARYQELFSSRFLLHSEALSRLASDAGFVPLTGIWNSQLGVATFMDGRIPLDALDLEGGSTTDAKTLLSFLDRYGEVFAVSDTESELKPAGMIPDGQMKHYSFQQVYQGIEVFGATINMHTSGASNLVAVNSNLIPRVHGVAIVPTITVEEAVRTVTESRAELLNGPKLVIYSGFRKDPPPIPALCWYIELTNDEASDFSFFVDATSGKMIDSIARVTSSLERMIYDGNFTSRVPGLPKRREGDPPTGDATIDGAHDLLEDVYRYFRDAHEMDSYDNRGSAISAIVNYRTYGTTAACNNASWDHSRRLIRFCESAAVKDIAAHEFTHAITQFALPPTGLIYYKESGALSESFADIFASLVDSANWDYGEGTGRVLRSLSDPGQHGLPTHVRDWRRRCTDFVEVHANSSIVNKAFYLIASGIGRKKAGDIFFHVLTKKYLTTTSSFSEARAAVISATRHLYSADRYAMATVIYAFDNVGITPEWRSPVDCIEQAEHWNE